MTDRALSVEQLVDAGVVAFKSRDFKSAVKYLLEATDQEPRHWRGKLYLAMSYYYGGEVFMAARQCLFLIDNATDQEIRKKAELAFAALGPEMKGKMPEMTCTLKKPQLSETSLTDEVSVVDANQYYRP
jgi:hypothetical protein